MVRPEIPGLGVDYSLTGMIHSQSLLGYPFNVGHFIELRGCRRFIESDPESWSPYFWA